MAFRQSMGPTMHSIPWRRLHDAVGARPAGPALIAWLGLIRHWHARARQRRQLALLEPRLLRDIGIRREDALAEAAKWFWED
jgi:uncharacterized protein YjiS (DUF1127 family)